LNVAVVNIDFLSNAKFVDDQPAYYYSTQTAYDECGNGAFVSYSQLIQMLPCGCMDPNSCNYDALAMVDDGSCLYDNCMGCTDPNACNFNANASTDDGSCYYFTAVANAGADQYMATPRVYLLTLNALSVAEPAFGTWSTNLPFVSINNLNNPNATLTFQTPAYVEANLVWTVYDSICNVIVSDAVHHSMTGCNMTGSASAGSNLVNICQGYTITIIGSIANFPVTSLWTIVSGSATILNPTDQIAYVTNLGLGNNVFQYTINRSACSGGVSSDENVVGVIECFYDCTNLEATNYDANANYDN
jgi:hypothetical protein